MTIQAGHSLSLADASFAATLLADAEIPEADKESFLIALADKGETPEEVAGFAQTFRGLAVDPQVGDFAARGIDIVGTGGDGAQSYNISSTASLIVAALGVPVLKHGNRSITSKCGSADFLEALGMKLDPGEARVAESLAELHFCFFFAPGYHPAFKSIAPVRKKMAAAGRRSIFNLLGPLINPARPAHQLLGVYAEKWVEPVAGALTQLNLDAALVAFCKLEDGKGMDELTTAGENRIRGTGRLSHVDETSSADTFQLPGCNPEQLRGGDVAYNLKILDALMDGEAPAGLEDTVCLNAGAALWIAGKADSAVEGIETARECLTDGTLQHWLSKLKKFYST